jgi:predicted alpha-1,2-mannosidase
MNRLVMTFAALLGLLGLRAAERDFTQYVNPLMGTQSSFELSAGNTYPVTALPWGMNFWTPQTGKMGDGWQYTYTANRIRGFKQTHQPSPWINDFGQFSLMPVTGSPEFDEDRRASWFSHKGETLRPYYYKVYLAEHDVVAEMAPTERAALFRFTFPETEQAYVVVDAFDRGSSVRIIPGENKVVGYSTRNSGGVPAGFRNYFVMVFDRPFEYRATFADSVLTENVLEQTAGHAGAVVGFRTAKGEQVHVRVASSFISSEQAELNAGTRCWDVWKWKGERWISTARSTPVCIVRCFSLTSSMKWMPAERPCITVPRQGRCCRDIITPEPGCGIPSAVSFRC